MFSFRSSSMSLVLSAMAIIFYAGERANRACQRAARGGGAAGKGGQQCGNVPALWLTGMVATMNSVRSWSLKRSLTICMDRFISSMSRVSRPAFRNR